MYQSDLLKGRVVLITGGGTGLGRAMALRFAELGARVFITGRREEPLKQTVNDINALVGTTLGSPSGVSTEGGASPAPRTVRPRAAYATCDVRDFAAVDTMAACARRELGEVDTLVNNAAGNFLARTEKLTPNAFQAVVGIVLNGTFNCTQAQAQRWIATGRPGTVLNIVTTYASCGSGSAFVVPSACAKAGVLAMTRSLAVEWARHKIRLNAIAPGPFPTEGAWSRLLPSKEIEERMLAAHPMKRWGRHDELANLAVYLISPQSEYVNGECVTIDGGQWLRGAGEFNDAVEIPESMWEMMESARKKG
jgi:NAD(P)-dependent dehydrogenase (short-subunit alcohol dehydrogenase family)